MAGREFVTLEDIAPRPDGRRVPPGPLIESIKDKLEMVASGEVVVIAPATTHLTSLRPRLTSVPLTGVEPSHVVLAKRADDHRRLVAAFRCSTKP